MQGALDNNFLIDFNLIKEERNEESFISRTLIESGREFDSLELLGISPVCKPREGDQNSDPVAPCLPAPPPGLWGESVHKGYGWI